MIVIAEAGATKTDWRAKSMTGEVTSAQTSGINAANMPQEVISAIVAEAMAVLNPKGEPLSEVHFYGAGVLSDEMARYFPGADVECASDLLAAARAVCGHAPGIAAIMGTGSNSCFYDGSEIVKNVHSSGFILGDEGGGACLGKLFMADFLKGLVPEPVASEFEAEFEVDYLTVVKNVYRGSAPAAYLGSFAPWIMARYDSSDYVRELVDGNIRSFFRRCLSQYDTASYPVGIIGGYGAACRDIVMRIAGECGVAISGITASPLKGLLSYHEV